MIPALEKTVFQSSGMFSMLNPLSGSNPTWLKCLSSVNKATST